MMLTSNYFILKHVLYNLRVAGSHLVNLCGKTGDGMCRLVSNAFSIGSPPGLCQRVGDSLIGPPRETIPPGFSVQTPS